jgi:hypothetical protein
LRHAAFRGAGYFAVSKSGGDIPAKLKLIRGLKLPRLN